MEFRSLCPASCPFIDHLMIKNHSRICCLILFSQLHEVRKLLFHLTEEKQKGSGSLGIKS